MRQWCCRSASAGEIILLGKLGEFIVDISGERPIRDELHNLYFKNSLFKFLL